LETLRVRVTPRASSARVQKDGDLYKVYVTVVAEDGKANAAVIELLAKELGVPKSSLSITRGMTGRDKVIAINR
jgi:uncharacterized protein